MNFWNGKVQTLKRDLDFQQSFSEKMQEENSKLQEDVDNLNYMLSQKDKDLNLAQREAQGLKEDNERLSRMYQLVQKEAFTSFDRLKKGGSQAVINSEQTVKNSHAYQDNSAQPPSNRNKVTEWRNADEGLGGRK